MEKESKGFLFLLMNWTTELIKGKPFQEKRLAPKEETELDLVKVVARYRNGRLIKGFTRNFFPNKDRFHVSPPDNPYGEPKGILMKDLKAVFFVRDFTGDSQYRELKKYVEGQSIPGKPVEIKFWDGEVLVGATTCYDANRPGFFVFPADPKSNNVKVYAIASSVERVRRL